MAKTGGLADVVGSLPSALRAFGDETAVFVPRYGTIDLKGLRRVYDTLPVHLGAARYDCSIYEAPEEFPLYLLDCPPLFERKGIYGESGLDYPDNHIRFAVFARAALEVARRLFRTDVFHCHDWQAGLVPAYLRSTFATDPTFFGARTLFTIHNLGYQGLFPKTVLPEIALDPALFRAGEIEFFGSVSYIKAGIALADALSTVSPTYAREIQTPEYGFGLEGILQARAGALTGILNGVDYSEWNPETDPLIPAHYSAGDLAGKRVCKEQLLAEFGLPPEAMDAPADRGRFAPHPPEGRGPAGRSRPADSGRRRLPGGVGNGRSGVRGVLPATWRKPSGPRGRAHRVRQCAGSPHRGRRRHVPDAQPLRAVRAEPDLQPEIRDGPGGARHGRPG